MWFTFYFFHFWLFGFFFWQGGAAENLDGKIIELNKRVLAPKWYWKAVCDPVGKQSIFFLGENTIADLAENQKKVQGCLGITQQKRSGVIYCYSLTTAKKDFTMFQIPEFHEKNCVPSKIGENFYSVLEKNLVWKTARKKTNLVRIVYHRWRVT